MAVASVIGVPLSLVVTPLAARRRSQSGWAVAVTLTGALGVAGLLFAPTVATWLWVVCLGVGMGVFAIAVALISLRTRSSADTRQLSTMAQSTGYLLAAVGPLLVGVLRGASGNWTVSLVVVLAALGVQVVIGALAGRDRLV
jgi:CP family cyanate transporter-like MFS transporter